MRKRPNIVFLLADQLRASALPVYDEQNIKTPNIDKLAGEGVVYGNAISNCPVCTPYRSMLLTGKYPQTTGHIMNFVNTRYDEIGWGDIFKHAGYKTGWVGKWHLHTGAFPTINNAKDFVPEGRPRLGFDYFRAYNFHAEYFGGHVAVGDWRCERWKGYETKGLLKYAKEFLDDVGEQSFCLFISPHQPHYTEGKFAPENYYDLIGDIKLPPNVHEDIKGKSLDMYRHYLAMTLAVDGMVGDVSRMLEDRGLSGNTIFVFTSDHGTQGGSQGIKPWAKKMPWEESIHIPFIMRWPDKLKGGMRNDSLFCPADLLPSFMSICEIQPECGFEGNDVSEQLLCGAKPTDDSDSVFLMNFCDGHDYAQDGNEWRGIRTRRYTYAKWLDAREILYDNINDKYQQNNIAEDTKYSEVLAGLKSQLKSKMQNLADEFPNGSGYSNWFDNERRIIRNAKGLLPHPEEYPELIIKWESH